MSRYQVTAYRTDAMAGQCGLPSRTYGQALASCLALRSEPFRTGVGFDGTPFGPHLGEWIAAQWPALLADIKGKRPSMVSITDRARRFTLEIRRGA